MSDKPFFSNNRLLLIIYLLLIVVTLAVYWQINKFDFINFDDNIYISENPVIQSGLTLQGLIWSFGSKYFGLWNPLVWLSLMVDYELYGLNAGGYHVTNLILHILGTLLLFWLFCRMTGAVWKSAFVAALFALHPLHVESVAWIAERKDVLSAFFWMLTLCFYVYYTEKPVLKRYLPVLFSFILALMSKPMVITLPVIMILLDYWPLKRLESEKGNILLWQLKEKLPFFILSLVLVTITFYAPGQKDFTSLSVTSRLLNAPVAFMAYLGKTFWPVNLAVFYPFPTDIPVWQVIGALLGIILITAVVMITARRMPYFLTGWFWYGITIFPVIGIVQIGDFMMADRYHYLPSIGIGIMLAWGTPLLFPKEGKLKKAVFSTAILSLVVLAFLSWKQCGFWKDSTSLFNHALRVTENNYLAHNNLASALLEKGKTQKAIDHFDKAISINNYAAAHYNKGVICYRTGQTQQAVMNFNDAIRVKPNYAQAYFNLGIIYHFSGQYQTALKNYDEAIRLMPAHANAYNNRAFIYLNMGNKFAGCSNALKACALGNCQTLTWAKERMLCN